MQDESTESNRSQIDFWNDRGEATWVPSQERMDRMLRPLGVAALDAAELELGQRVLDIGCGCGDTTLEIAERVGDHGQVIGIDVSGPMLSRARDRAKDLDNVVFVQADAQTTDIASLSVDRLVSRFGVMFFDEPEVAFENLREALVPGGRLSFVCWQTAKQNPWMSYAVRSVADLLELPKPDPRAPGPFSLGEREVLVDVLDSAGFSDIELSVLEGELDTVGGSTLVEAVQHVIEMSPLETLIGDDDELEALVRERISAAIEAEWDNGVVNHAFSCWIATAEK